VLNSIPDQDTFYDVSDLLEEQGMQGVVGHYRRRQASGGDEHGLARQIAQQMELYEASLAQEDGEENGAANGAENGAGNGAEDLNSSFSSGSTASSSNNKSSRDSLATNLRYAFKCLVHSH